MTVPEYEELVSFLRQQTADLTAERDKLRAESENASRALNIANEANTQISRENTDMLAALTELGLEEGDVEIDVG